MTLTFYGNSPGRAHYSKSVSVAKIGKGSVNNNEKPLLQRKKSKTTDDIIANKPTVEEIEESNHLATSGENGTDSENSPTPRRKRSFSDMSNIVVSNTKQKELEETNEEHAKKAQIQRQQSKNFLKSFYKSLKHSFSSTSKRNLAHPAKEGHNQNNDETKEAKKADDNEHDDKAHKKDKKEIKKMHKQSSLGNVKDKDKIKSSKPSKSATSPNMHNNSNTNNKK